VSSRSLGVYYTLGNTLSVKVRQEINQVEVLEEERAFGTCSLDGVRVGHGHAVGGSVDSLLGGSSPICVVAVDIGNGTGSNVAVGVLATVAGVLSAV